MRLDDTDKKILRELVSDNKQSTKELSQKVNLSITPVHERIKKLENSDYIIGNTALLNYEKLGYGTMVILQVKILKHQHESFDKFISLINSLDEVVEAFFVAGEYDAIVKVILKDMDDYQKFILEKFAHNSFIESVRSYFKLRHIKGKNFAIHPELIK